jgi:hypothetical protein
MPHAIIRGKNGRRHEVDFSDAPIRVEIYASDETIEIFVEADFETHAQERRRFAILNVPRNLFRRRLARLPGVRQRAASKTACIGDGRWGRRLSMYREGASRDASTALSPRWRETALIESTRAEASWGRSISTYLIR